MTHNTWQDRRITGHPSIDESDPVVRRAAEFIHRNESLHRHDPSGAVCVYCAINASRAMFVFARGGQLRDVPDQSAAPVDTSARCGSCGHRLAEHGGGGCAADDEAAMGGCDCAVKGEPREFHAGGPVLGPGGTRERPFA